MNYISLFSGIEAASCAWEDLNLSPILFSEINPYPASVLKYHYPSIPNVGDITKVDWSKYSNKIDLIVGGSPCQSFSYAGKREGLNGESRLMFEYIIAIQEVRSKWLIGENVPGVLSSGKGNDFRFLLNSLAELGYSLAWRILDSKYFGVPQQRRRVFVVGCLGKGGSGPAAPFISFNPPRHLMPIECERIQGFPDNWTNVPGPNGKLLSNTRRYKMIGNSMAVPVMRWINERILMVENNANSKTKM